MNPDGGTLRRAAGTAVLGAVLCVVLLAGCRARDGAAGQSGGAPAATVSGAATTPPGAAGATGMGTQDGTPVPDSSIDANLNSVNQDLGSLDSALAKATQSAPGGD
jgi:hypothetical protein